MVLWGLDHIGLTPNPTPRARTLGWVFVGVGVLYAIVALALGLL